MPPQPTVLCRTLSSFVGWYPFKRGQTRLRALCRSWLVCQLSFGCWIRVSGVVDAEWNFLEGGSKEDATSALIRSMLRPGAVFVDVGANIGYFTLMAASTGATSIAYEPTPAVFARMQENLALNTAHAQVINAAVMDRAGSLEFHLSADDPEANSLFGSGECIVVPGLSLDEDLKQRDISGVDLLKIDVEGAEPLVLDGARELLSSPNAPDIVIEVNSYALGVAGFTPEDVYSRLEEFGYNIWTIEREMYNGLPVSNVLAHKGREARAFHRLMDESSAREYVGFASPQYVG